MNDLSEQEERPERPVEADGTAHLFRALGKQIKALREAAGLHQRELAVLLHVGEDLIGAIERGVRTPQPDLLERADGVLGARGVLRAAIPEVKEALKRVRTRHPDWFQDYAEAEATTQALHSYAHQGVPGLLQTESHAREIFMRRRPLLAEETIETRIQNRLTRQQIFERWPSPTFSFILDHNLLERWVGGPDVHRDQLQRFMRIAQLRTVELQVMQYRRGAHAAMDGTFTLLHPKGRQQVAYHEAYGRPHLITDPNQVRIMSERYGIIRGQALAPDESLALIEKTLGEIR